MNLIQRLTFDTHLDEAREESGFLDTVCDVEKLEDGEELTQTHDQAHGVKRVR